MNAIYSSSGSWRVDENGELVVKKVTAEIGEFGKLKVGAQEKPEGVTIYDQITGEPKCVVVVGDVVKAEQGVCGIDEGGGD